MIFKKSTKITYTEMAQWIDLHTNTLDYDKDIMCEYLYHLIYLRAKQLTAFKDPDQLDDFALYCTSRLLIRLKNCSRSKEPIKSIVNYIRNIIDLWKADYIREFCTGSPETEIADFNVVDYSDYLIDVASTRDFFDYSVYSIDPVDVIKKHLNMIPRKIKSAEWSNIYVSCLLTLNDRINAARHIGQLSSNNDQMMKSAAIRKLKTRPAILYHLDEQENNYILTLVNQLVHSLSVAVSEDVGYKVSSSDCMIGLIAAANEDAIEEKL